MNIPVSFELAKLLKEKGFEQKTKSYTEDGKLVAVSLTIRRFNPEKIYYPAPTIAEVVMWLYEKHGIWIASTHVRNRFRYEIIKKDGMIEYSSFDYKSPEAAYEAAIEYVSNKLI